MARNREVISELAAAGIRHAAQQLAQNPELLNDPKFIQAVTAGQLAVCGNDAAAALNWTVREALKHAVESGQLAAAIEDFQRRIREQPTVVQILSQPFRFGLDGHAHPMVYCDRGGSGQMPLWAVSFDSGSSPPELFGYYFTDPEGKMILGAAPAPPLRLEEREVHAARVESGAVPGAGELAVRDTTGRGEVLYTHPALATDIHQRLERGEQVLVQSSGLYAHRIIEAQLTHREDWIEFEEFPITGQRLSDMVYPKRLQRELRLLATSLSRGDPVMAIFQGPTGNGKSTGAQAVGRTAADDSGKPLATVRLSPGTAGSSFVYETERTMHRALQRARALVEEGWVVLILVDEMNAFLGAPGGRYEGSVDSRVRLTLQTEFEPIPGCAIVGTMNPGRTDFLPAPIVRRFNLVTFPRSTRGQLAEVAVRYCDRAVVAACGLTPQRFGEQLADFIFSNHLVLGTIQMHSGASLPLLARDIHDCSSPGTIKRLVEVWARELKYGFADSLQALWARIWQEFRGSVHQINEFNLHERTFVQPLLYDSVKRVEPVADAAWPQALAVA